MHKLSLTLKLQLSLIIVIGAAFLKLNAWHYLGAYGIIALCWAISLRVAVRKLTGLLGLELVYLSFKALPLGLVRSLVCLLTMNSFLLTLPPHSFGIALKGLPLPRPLKETLLLAGQYLEILLGEVTQMQRSAKLRGLNGTTGWIRYANASMIGALYLRSLDRAERVYAAMIARGYNGMLPVDSTPRIKERFALLAMGFLACSLTTASYQLLF